MNINNIDKFKNNDDPEFMSEEEDQINKETA